MPLGASAGLSEIDLRAAGLLTMPKKELTGFAAYFANMPPARAFSDDCILAVIARNGEETADLTDLVNGDALSWEKPDGEWTLQVCTRSRNTGYHRDYINVTEEESCKVLIDAVYEPHWEHYAADFGKTIAGFFSDEPELGNGAMYETGNVLGKAQDLPWGGQLENAVIAALGDGWRTLLPLLWSDGEDAAKVRGAYMDCLTKRVRAAFSYQIGDWCHAHGVQYIGHIIEDDGQHCRTGSSLGHYFRSLQGQDMAGVDDIGGQVLPQGEDGPTLTPLRQPRDGTCYHYALAKLAQSAAAIEPRKNGNAMCEIFGNYGWSEGVHLEKYLADHFLVRGINYFVPHAFSPADFPDKDCPPHFYAHGHNPQYRHFGALCGYMNRVATLTSSGKHSVPVAVLYHGESEWADSNATPFEKPLRALYDEQIDCHVLPADIFAEPDLYETKLGEPLVVNGRRYHAFVVPYAAVLPKVAVCGLAALAKLGLPIYFAEKRPQAIAETGEPLPQALANCPTAPLAELPNVIRGLLPPLPTINPKSDRIRILAIQGDTPAYFIVNEAAETYNGVVTFPGKGGCYLYDAWSNCCMPAQSEETADSTRVTLAVEPLKSIAVIFGDCDVPLAAPIVWGEEIPLTDWRRSICEGSVYPNFEGTKSVTLPDALAEEQPEFSGFVRYETSFEAVSGTKYALEITDAAEGIEVFVNGQSAGIQIAAPYRYDLTPLAKSGGNQLVIEVATTLERQCYPILHDYQKRFTQPPTNKSGITGIVRLFRG
jgi:hypothetical protein